MLGVAHLNHQLKEGTNTSYVIGETVTLMLPRQPMDKDARTLGKV